MSQARFHGDRPVAPLPPSGPKPRPITDDGDLRPDAYDALTDLFLSEVAAAPPAHLGAKLPQAEGGPRTAALSEPCPVRIEGLILGHLPVLASAWVQQYARH